MSKITISNSSFMRSHGKAPKGFGRWAFDVMDDSSSRGSKIHTTFFAPHSMSYAEAKKWAVAHIKANFAAEWATGFMSVEVAP